VDRDSVSSRGSVWHYFLDYENAMRRL
jgi:hypothetical protein